MLFSTSGTAECVSVCVIIASRCRTACPIYGETQKLSAGVFPFFFLLLLLMWYSLTAYTLRPRLNKRKWLLLLVVV